MGLLIGLRVGNAGCRVVGLEGFHARVTGSTGLGFRAEKTSNRYTPNPLKPGSPTPLGTFSPCLSFKVEGLPGDPPIVTV